MWHSLGMFIPLLNNTSVPQLLYLENSTLAKRYIQPWRKQVNYKENNHLKKYHLISVYPFYQGGKGNTLSCRQAYVYCG